MKKWMLVIILICPALLSAAGNPAAGLPARRSSWLIGSRVAAVAVRTAADWYIRAITAKDSKLSKKEQQARLKKALACREAANLYFTATDFRINSAEVGSNLNARKSLWFRMTASLMTLWDCYHTDEIKVEFPKYINFNLLKKVINFDVAVFGLADATAAIIDFPQSIAQLNGFAGANMVARYEESYLRLSENLGNRNDFLTTLVRGVAAVYEGLGLRKTKKSIDDHMAAQVHAAYLEANRIQIEAGQLLFQQRQAHDRAENEARIAALRAQVPQAPALQPQVDRSQNPQPIILQIPDHCGFIGDGDQTCIFGVCEVSDVISRADYDAAGGDAANIFEWGPANDRKVLLACGHAFCNGCIRQAVTASGGGYGRYQPNADKCPTCRKAIPASQFAALRS